MTYHTETAKRLAIEASRAGRDSASAAALVSIAHSLIALTGNTTDDIAAQPAAAETKRHLSPDADDPVLEAIFQEMRHHPARARSRTDWLNEPPFKDDAEARARLRAEAARRVAFNLGKLQAIDEYDQHTGTLNPAQHPEGTTTNVE